MGDLSVLQSVWLVAVVALWALYLALEGFDFGVGMLLPRVCRDRLDRRVALHAIGPTWAANEVWVIVAVVGMLGAFPAWYAAWGAAFYAPLAIALLALVARNAGIELLGKRDDERWRRGWERAIVWASVAAPFCWGLIWAAAVEGVALRGDEVLAGPLDVVTPYSLLGGVALVALSRAQGAAFLLLRTGDGVRERARRELVVAAPAAALACGAFLAWTAAARGPGAVAWAALGGCAAALAAVTVAAWRGRPGPAFAAATGAVVLLVVAWFATLFPAGMAQRGGVGSGLSLADAAAGDYTLTLMLAIAGLMVPLLLAAQAWTYWAFRSRVTRAAVGEEPPSPVDLLERLTGGDDDGADVPRGPGFRRRHGGAAP